MLFVFLNEKIMGYTVHLNRPLPVIIFCGEERVGYFLEIWMSILTYYLFVTSASGRE
jgi:hypothetical protein